LNGIGTPNFWTRKKAPVGEPLFVRQRVRGAPQQQQAAVCAGRVTRTGGVGPSTKGDAGREIGNRRTAWSPAFACDHIANEIESLERAPGPLMRSHAKKPGAVSRPGRLREFQFHEYSDLQNRVNGCCLGEIELCAARRRLVSLMVVWLSGSEAARVRAPKLRRSK
jgi:hypothetical protein